MIVRSDLRYAQQREVTLATRRKRPAAPPTPPEKSSQERVEWLLEFLRRDVADLTLGAVYDFKSGIFPYLHEPDLAAVTDFPPQEMIALGPIPPSREGVTLDEALDIGRDYMAALQHKLREGLEALEAKGQWWPFEMKGPDAPHWFFEQRNDGTIRRSYGGTHSTITLAIAAELLVQWWPDLRRCGYEGCRCWFLPRHGRQRYHAPACRQANFRRQEREKRDRDYQAEYATQVEKDSGKSIADALRKKQAKKKATKKKTTRKGTRKGKSR